MDIDLLRTFVAICDSGSFTAAARRVGRTQSAVSLQIRRLEASLGRPLFIRGTGRLELTEHGELLLGHARPILHGVGRALADFDRGSLGGVLVFGLPDDYAPRVLDRVLRIFAAGFPEAQIDIVIDESRTLVTRLADGSVDLAFVTDSEGPIRGGPIAFRDRLVFVAPAEGELHRETPLPVAVWDGGDTYATALFAALAGMGRSHRIAVACRSMTGLRAAVRSGVAVSVMVGSSVEAGMRLLGPAEGFPALAEVAIRLERAHRRRSALVERFEAALVADFVGEAGGGAE
jgi:DNA-binding transcriptional LysR family regulator